ncbi:beta-L-arabinofuranosidase domain-containing protein [Propionimicrobium sp. PCR01-08-3]|uniref:glycoside hydrolase family 127 protein n=1 Tax=Propionimicrobium sp. PCR01-08-3 TaxID=3052086 RepID=UPI00255C8B89|nr:beta-L-arabinofuranosidase domain-containing protein [Propionimicrobium sp. PCR01-08-3]WIY81901.1 glycoside hydrolase family 127 protein [Propionimicrobium sp. PCR01-08-3]
MHIQAGFSPVVPGAGALRPLGIDHARITGGFWGRRQWLNREAIIPHALKWETRVGWIDNFVHTAAGDIADHRHGREFSDSDVYKLVEAMAWEVGRTGDLELDAEIERLGSLIEACQHDDGYLNTRFGNPGQQARYSDFAWGHELYCYGHLIQAAVARLRTGHEGTIVRVALKAADHVLSAFGENGRHNVCGHPEIEVALAELSRVTGEPRYLEQAQIFLDRRGHGILPDIEFGRSYYQDDEPFRESRVLRGHSVRALYLCAAAVDIAVESGDAELLAIARKQYDATLARRTYLTGGMGSHHQDEAFGDDFELPPDRSYCETCAGIGSIMVAWRLLLATGELGYGDIIERTLFNIVATSPSAAGDAFFYANTLHRRTPAAQSNLDEPLPRASSSLRAPWFDVSCCPTNVARTLTSLAGLLATSSDDGVQIVHYADAELTATIAAGAVRLRVETDYPDDGEVVITVAEAPGPFSLDLRIPGWASGATVDGEAVSVGTHRIADVVAGRTIRLCLPLEPRLTYPDDRIDAVRGAVAVERGPLVLCSESVDLPEGVAIDGYEVEAGVLPRPAGRTGATMPARRVRHDDSGWPYGSTTDPEVTDAIEVPLAPYHAWGNRGPTSMRIWLPERTP